MDISSRRVKTGNKIRELREKENWNQARLGLELSKALGKAAPIAGATISRYEEGKRSIKTEVLEALAGIFKVKSSFFYGDEHAVSEPRAAYDAGPNTIRVAVIEEIPLGFPETGDKDIAGFAEFPRFLFPGAKYIIKVGDGFFCENGIKEGDYILIAPAEGERAGQKLFYKNEGIFFVGHPSRKSAHCEIIGHVIGIIKKP